MVRFDLKKWGEGFNREEKHMRNVSSWLHVYRFAFQPWIADDEMGKMSTTE